MLSTVTEWLSGPVTSCDLGLSLMQCVHVRVVVCVCAWGGVRAYVCLCVGAIRTLLFNTIEVSTVLCNIVCVCWCGNASACLRYTS